MPVQSDWAFCQCKITRVVVLPLLSMSPQPLALHCCGLADAVALLRSPNAASPESNQSPYRGPYSHYAGAILPGASKRALTHAGSLLHTHTQTTHSGKPHRRTMWIMTCSPACSRTVINFSDSMVQLAKVIASALMLSAGICAHPERVEKGKGETHTRRQHTTDQTQTRNMKKKRRPRERRRRGRRGGVKDNRMEDKRITKHTDAQKGPKGDTGAWGRGRTDRRAVSTGKPC
jgi:hypothetical protein